MYSSVSVRPLNDAYVHFKHKPKGGALTTIRLNDLKTEYTKCTQGPFSPVRSVSRGLYVIMDIHHESLYPSLLVGFYVEMHHDLMALAYNVNGQYSCF